jgi:hypothetical protein
MDAKAKQQRALDAARRVALVDIRTGATRPGNESTSATHAASMWETFQAAAAAASKSAGISRSDFLALLTQYVGPSIQLIEDGLVLSGSLNVPIWTRTIKTAISTWKKTGSHDEQLSGSVKFLSDSAEVDTAWLTKNSDSSKRHSMSERDKRTAKTTGKGQGQSEDIGNLKHPTSPQLHERIEALVEAAAEQVRAAINADNRKKYEIAAAAGITRVTLSQFMGGSKKLAPETLDRIATILGITLRP